MCNSERQKKAQRGARTRALTVSRHQAETDVKRDLMMANRQNGTRACVMIVEQDPDFGIKLADWLAIHAYQPVLVRSVDAAIEELREISPQVVFIGGGHPEPEAQSGISELLLLVQALCPGVPVITIANQTSEDLTHDVFRQGIHHVLVKPIEFTQISHVLRPELNSATV
jgi:DNA-binding NtrC family response regulator